MTLNGVMAVTLRYFTMVNLRCRKRSVAEFMQESIVFLVRVQCRRKESSRSLSHLLMSFLSIMVAHSGSQDTALGRKRQSKIEMIF